MFSLDLELGTVEWPYIRSFDEASVVLFGFGVGVIAISRYSILGTAKSWHEIAYAMGTKKQINILEKGIEDHVNSNVLLTRLRYEAEKHSRND